MKKYLPSLMFFILLLIIWEWAVRYFEIKEYILPSPSAVGSSLINKRVLLWDHGLQTIYEAVLGFLLAIGAGLFLSVAMGLSPGVKRTIYPLMVVSQTIPIVALAPLFIIWFGYVMMPKVVTVILICFFPITLSLVEGLSTVDDDMVKLLTAMGASPWQVFRKVKFPGAMPSFFAGLKISATYSVMGAIIGEWLGASKGLGIYMTRSMKSFLTDQLFAAIAVVSILSLLFFAVVEITGRMVMPWYYQK